MMRRISYSNIAWELADEPTVADLLRHDGIDAVDIAPGKYFPDPGTTTKAEALAVRDWWQERGIEILGMQALLFGVAGLNLFGEPPMRLALLDRLSCIARIAGWIGATRLVFGSPKSRDRGSLGEDQALDISVPFFRSLGERASEHGVQFCLEPNPIGYACNFMTTTDEGAAVVRAVDHAGIRLHLDAGAMAMNGEDPAVQVARHFELVGYVHASEPNLAPVGHGPIHHALAQALDLHLPNIPVSIEMRGVGLSVLPIVISAVRSAYQRA